LKDKADRWNNNEEIRSILAEIESTNGDNGLGKFNSAGSADLMAKDFDRQELSSKGLRYERLDQLTMDILFGVD
jgi:xylose isomerase